MKDILKLYEVVSPQAVMVDHDNGNSLVYSVKTRFTENPNNKSIVRLLRINAIREVTSREIPSN